MIPAFVHPYLYSYNIDDLDVSRHAGVIIRSILVLGNQQSVDWMKGQYSRDQIREVIEKQIVSDWNRKAMNYWSLIYGVQPKQTRFG